MRRGFMLALLALLVVLPASGHASSARPSTGCDPNDTMITIADFSFTPNDVTVAPGTTVCWTNTGDFAHTVNSDPPDATLDSGQLANGAFFEFTFTTEGDYLYHCNNHTFMTGTVHVATPPPPPPPP